MTEDRILELASTHVYKGWFDDDNVIEFARAIQREALLEAAGKCAELDGGENMFSRTLFVGYGLFHKGELVTCSPREIVISIGRNAIECLPLYTDGKMAEELK
jgi:hypothetical protein